MGKIRKCIILIVLPVFACATAFSQDTLGFKGFTTPKFPYKQNVIKSCPVPILVGQIVVCGELRLMLEHMITHNQSLSIGASYNFPNLFLLMITAASKNRSIFKHLSMRGARVMAGYRYYPLRSKKAPDGFFFGPYFSYNFVNIREKHGSNNYEVINYLDAGIIAGYQFIAGNHFSLEGFGGFGYRDNFILNYNAHLNKTYTTFIPQIIPAFEHVKFFLQMNLGYAF